MSWLGKLYNTYEANICAVDAASTGTPLLPLYHTIQKAHIEIVLDVIGNFKRAAVINGIETIIPATEDSAGRTSGEAPHPLCDKIQYIAADYGRPPFRGTKASYFGSYFKQLEEWNLSVSHTKLQAITTYVRKGQVVADLVVAKVLCVDAVSKELALVCPPGPTPPEILRVLPKDPNQKVEGKAVQEKGGALVRWRVEIPGAAESGCWEDERLRQAWIGFAEGSSARDELCMVSGARKPPAVSHPRRIRNGGDGAKLISSNDASGYTFRGRFAKAEDAATISSEVSQKAHSALRWLIGRQAYRNQTQAIVAWTVGGKRVPDPLANSDELLADELEPEERSAETAMAASDAGQAFAGRLGTKIRGFRTVLGPADEVLILGLDSATPGRIAVTFYRELAGSNFLDRLEAWHTSFAWSQKYGRDRGFIGAPSPRDIAQAAYGSRLDEKLERSTVERILPCIVDGRRLPRDLMEASVRRASRRLGGKRGEDDWEKLVGIGCALYKGYYIERNYQMGLEADRRSRDYLYGRLLAIAEHVEGRALYIADEKRETTSARLMARFADRPYTTWATIEKSLAPYKSRLKSRAGGYLAVMSRLLDEVHCLFERPEDFTDDKPLTGEYLLGYHCQRAALNTKAVNTNGADAPKENERTGSDDVTD